MKIKVLSSLAAATTFLFASCTSPSNMTNAQKQAIGGAAVGGVAGAVIGNNVGDGNAARGAAIGAAAGGAAGYLHGKHKDNQGY